MKIARLRIERFRAIRESDIRLGQELALVGQNSAGKSSILRALNCFFNFEDEEKAFIEGRHQYSKSSVSIIDIEFSDVPPHCNLLRQWIASDSVRARLKYKRSASWQIWHNGTWLTAPNTLHQELTEVIHYAYVPLKRDHETSSWSERGLLRAAIGAWMKHTLRRDRITPKIADLAESVRKRSFSGLGKALRKVTPINGEFSFDLDFTEQPSYQLLLRDLTLKVTESNKTVELEDCGSGTQSMTAFAIYSFLAELQGTTYILGVEEPEQNLHPQAQRVLLANLRKLPLQVVFSTHSTVLVDELKHDEVVLCRRVKSSSRGIEVTTTQLDPAFWATANLDQDRYYQFHRRRNSEFFFANFVILVESPIDAEIARTIISRAGIDLNASGVSIISLDGVLSLPYAYHLLKALKIQFATIVDKDYFMPYLNDELDTSRDGNGFPRYRKEFKSGTLLNEMVPATADQQKLLDLLQANHSRAMDLLEKSNTFCFKWSLEIDMVNSGAARALLFSGLSVQPADQTTRHLLVDRKKAVKKLETLLPLARNLQPSNLPNSYKRIRKVIPALIRQAQC